LCSNADRIEASDVARALRGLLLSIDFDGHKTVACPLGDFFGAGPGTRPYASLPLGIDADGTLWCNWVMPYRDAARITIRNVGPAPAGVWLTLVDQPYAWSERSMNSHAGWAVGRDYPARPLTDWNYVTIQGQGVYVGSAFTIANPVKAWWGEGDEKVYVDGEKLPSHFGTGTEDYFGYAWCWPEPFTHAYHNQTQCDGPGNYGRTAINRWHVLDRIPFARNFRFDMEIWHWWEGRLPEFSVMTYWYARLGATDNRQFPNPADLAVVVLPAYVTPRVPGAAEGEALQIVAKTGTVEPQEIDNCSNEKHLWWRDGRPGDTLILSFPVAAAGRYRVLGRFVNATDYGIVRLTINGQPVTEPLDLCNSGVIAAAEATLGVFGLRAVEIVGANGQAVPKYMFGLDYLRLEPADQRPVGFCRLKKYNLKPGLEFRRGHCILLLSERRAARTSFPPACRPPARAFFLRLVRGVGWAGRDENARLTRASRPANLTGHDDLLENRQLRPRPPRAEVRLHARPVARRA
jgi:hypothetical protein